MSDTKRADSKSQRRGLESDGANPSDTPDVPNELLDRGRGAVMTLRTRPSGLPLEANQ